MLSQSHCKLFCWSIFREEDMDSHHTVATLTFCGRHFKRSRNDKIAVNFVVSLQSSQARFIGIEFKVMHCL